MLRATSSTIVLCALSTACAVEGELIDGEPWPDAGALETIEASCALGAPGVFTPYGGAGTHPSGPVVALPWRGRAGDAGGFASYPQSIEDFRAYGPALPELVECASDKRRRSHLEVTAGCLDAAAVGSYQRGRVRLTADGYFRALALGYTATDSVHPIKWTDQAIEYRFFHRGRTGTAGNPGFKAFARYRSEDDLYVASWRFDGVVQIQRKLCGEYVALAIDRDFGPPSAGVWHRLRFEAAGDQLRLWIDGELVLRAASGTFSWGTAGIRIDSADGAYLDDWRVTAPDPASAAAG